MAELHHTKSKGDLGVAKAYADLVAQGYLVLFPSTEHAPFDLVAYRDGVFHRIQVKYRAVRRGAVVVEFRSSWSDRNGRHVIPTDKRAIDVFCIYCPDTDRCYYVDPLQHGGCVSLRIEPARNGQTLGVHSAERFRLLEDAVAPPPDVAQMFPPTPRTVASGSGAPGGLAYADRSHGGRSSGG